MTIQTATVAPPPTPRSRAREPGLETVASEKRKMTYQEFLVWADEDTLAEWVDGEVILTLPASRQHQETSNFLNILLSFYVSVRNLGRVLLSPFQVKLGPDLPGREPDVLFVAREHLDRLKDTFLDGPADLIIEIISPESQQRDRGAKFYEYEAAGVSEYWLIDPQRRQAEFHQLGEDGFYHPVLSDAEGVYRSAVLPGFWLRVGWLWQDPLPTPVETLRLLTEMLDDGLASEAVQAFLGGV